MSLEPDIIERIQREFDRADAAIAIESLTASGHTGLIARCIVVASGGKLQSLRDHIDMANNDFRDVIVAGEYDRTMERVRDLSCSFLVDTPDVFWIARVAIALHARGFVLKSVVTRAATNGPFVYTSDYGEGGATLSLALRTFLCRWEAFPRPLCTLLDSAPASSDHTRSTSPQRRHLIRRAKS